MPETHSDPQAPRAAAAAPDPRDGGRRPFVAPSVEELGGLSELTLLGGSL